MRKITLPQIACFSALCAAILALSAGTTWLLLRDASLGRFNGVVTSACWVVLFYLFAFLVYRLFLLALPLHWVFLGLAVHRLGRSLRGWLALAVLLFPVGGAAALILLGWMQAEPSPSPAPAPAP